MQLEQCQEDQKFSKMGFTVKTQNQALRYSLLAALANEFDPPTELTRRKLRHCNANSTDSYCIMSIHIQANNTPGCHFSRSKYLVCFVRVDIFLCHYFLV